MKPILCPEEDILYAYKLILNFKNYEAKKKYEPLNVQITSWPICKQQNCLYGQIKASS